MYYNPQGANSSTSRQRTQNLKSEAERLSLANWWLRTRTIQLGKWSNRLVDRVRLAHLQELACTDAFSVTWVDSSSVSRNTRETAGVNPLWRSRCLPGDFCLGVALKFRVYIYRFCCGCATNVLANHNLSSRTPFLITNSFPSIDQWYPSRVESL